MSAQFSCKKFYLHPTDMERAYLDEEPNRLPELALAPSPSTVGPFYTEQAALTWVKDRKEKGKYTTLTEIVRKPA
jgi:hypothetical protein